jgi:hypothetical protein
MFWRDLGSSCSHWSARISRTQVDSESAEPEQRRLTRSPQRLQFPEPWRGDIEAPLRLIDELGE